MRRRVRKINGRIVREFEMNFPMIISIQEIQILFVILSSNHHHRPFHKFLLISSRNTSKTITFVSLNRHYLITIIKYVFTQPNILFITQRSLSLTFLLPQETDLSPSFPYLENNYSCFFFLLQFLSLARRSLFPTFLLSSFLPSFLIRSRSIESFDNVSPRQHRNNTCDSPTLSAKLPGREWNCKSGEARLSHTESRELSDAATSRLSSSPPDSGSWKEDAVLDGERDRERKGEDESVFGRGTEKQDAVLGRNFLNYLAVRGIIRGPIRRGRFTNPVDNRRHQTTWGLGEGGSFASNVNGCFRADISTNFFPTNVRGLVRQRLCLSKRESCTRYLEIIRLGRKFSLRFFFNY